MARFRECRYCGELHQLGRWPDNCRYPPPNRSPLPAPYIISDNLPGGVNGLYHHAECRKTDSKSQYRRWTKDNGCIEVGGERRAFEKMDADFRQRDAIPKDQTEHWVNEALAKHGIVSECDVAKEIE